jgi:hypothetical protein
LALLLFPRSALAGRLGALPFVSEVREEPGGGIQVRVSAYLGVLPADTIRSKAYVYYELDSRLRLERAWVGEDFKTTVARASSFGLLKPESFVDDAALADVRIWNGQTFVPIERTDEGGDRQP